jgi:predicted DNA-binding ribbon-helix-helix protein
MVRTQIQLTDEQYESLKRMAQVEEIPMAELVRRGVDKILRSSVAISEDEQRQRALEIAGSFRSGKKDISEKHDDYFVEAIED